MKYILALFLVFVLTDPCLHAQTQDDSLQKKADTPVARQKQSRPDSAQPVLTAPKVNRERPQERVDSVNHKADTGLPATASINRLERLLAFQQALRNHPYYRFFGEPIEIVMYPRVQADKDLLFYVLLALLFYYALVHALFRKYLNNLTALFFRVTMRQQQLREQLTQAQLPALLLNILFILAGGLYLSFLAWYYKWTSLNSIWLGWAYGSGMLLVVYLLKFLLLKMTGWIFRVSQATDTYISIVFMVNKIIGIFLLPVLWGLAFPHPALFQVIMTLSITVIAGLFLYRFLISYRPIRKEIKVNPFHFFIYLCAFEIAPLLLIYKLLMKSV